MAEQTADSRQQKADLHPELQRMRELANAATGGRWVWTGNAQSQEVRLEALISGRPFVLRFKRWGMRSSQPWFRDAARCLMVDVQHLLKFEVGNPTITGYEAAKADDSVYRYDIRDIDNPDARWLKEACPQKVGELLDCIAALAAELPDEQAEAILNARLTPEPPPVAGQVGDTP